MNHLIIGRLARISRCVTSRLGLDFSAMQASAGTIVLRRPMSSDTDFKPSEELAKERYDTRSGEDIDRKRARLLYQSRKRGMLENGVILASFADKYLQTLDADHLDQYDRLINLPTNDWDIFYWATKTKPTPDEFETPVMDMLRQHLKSKVSNEASRDKVLGKSGLDEIVLPAIKKTYELDIDVSKVDLTNYREQLFDRRTKTYRNGQSINLMTAWRKRFFEKRLKRVISSPTSLKTLSDDVEKQIYTQGIEDKDIASRIALPNDLIDSEYDKGMKHHEFLQHLLSSQLTDDPLEYDDEAEAWADMLWHRNYGSHDDKITPTRNFKCKSCHSMLHCCDPGLKGYVPREIFISVGTNTKLKPDDLTCQQCKFSYVYNAKLSHEVTPETYVDFLRHISTKRSAVIVVLVDLTDFPGSIWKGLTNLIEGRNKKVFIVGNKLDLLPYDGFKIIERVTYAVRKNLDRLRPGNVNKHIDDVMVISARTGFGVEGLITRILSSCEECPRDVYLIGSNNSGKSTLFSALLQSDLCALRKGDLISRVSRYQLPDSDVNMLRFPIDLVEGWQVEMKRRRQERVERNTAVRERSLGSTSTNRQESMPHMSMLVNRIDYLPGKENLSVIEVPHESEDVNIGSGPPVKFSDDHPMANIVEGEPMSATEEAFGNNTFFHHTPSSTNPDQLHDLLTEEERLEVFPNETIIPRKFSLRPLQTIFIAGLARLDLLTSQSNVIFTLFASKYLPIHVVQTKKADKFYNQFLGSPYLGVPFGNEARLAVWPDLVNSMPDFHIRGVAQHIGAADIVFSSVGWALINIIQDQECVVRAYTPGGRGIFLRDPPLLSKANVRSIGKKIRDTPLFNNPNYKIKLRDLESTQ